MELEDIERWLKEQADRYPIGSPERAKYREKLRRVRNQIAWQDQPDDAA